LSEEHIRVESYDLQMPDRAAMLHRRIADLELASLGYLRAVLGGEGNAGMAATLLCRVLGHPSKHSDEDVGCVCTIRKAGE
jgi:hypothetical protein